MPSRTPIPHLYRYISIFDTIDLWLFFLALIVLDVNLCRAFGGGGVERVDAYPIFLRHGW